MKRRAFLSSMMGATAVAAAASLPKPALAQGKKVLKLVTSWPRNYPGLGTSAQRIANQISLATDGEIKIKLYGADELVPAFGVFDAVASGAADMYHSAEYYWSEKSKAFPFFASVPFGMTGYETLSWLQELDGQKLWDELAAQYNIKPFAAASTGPQMGGWFNREINNFEDFKGLRIRMPGLGGEVLRQAGAIPVSLSGNKIVPAFKDNTIDAAEWIGPWSDLNMGLHTAAKYYYWPGFHEPGTIISFGVNLDLWNSFTVSQKNIIALICESESKRTLSEFTARNGEALDVLVQKHKIETRRLSSEVMTKLGEISGQVIADSVGNDPLARQIYKNYIENRQKFLKWATISDEAYLSARRLSFPYGRKLEEKSSKPSQEGKNLSKTLSHQRDLPKHDISTKKDPAPFREARRP